MFWAPAMAVMAAMANAGHVANRIVTPLSLNWKLCNEYTHTVTQGKQWEQEGLESVSRNQHKLDGSFTLELGLIHHFRLRFGRPATKILSIPFPSFFSSLFFFFFCLLWGPSFLTDVSNRYRGSSDI